MIYVHVPFCRSFCTYCGFYSEIARNAQDGSTFSAYADRIVAEASSRADEIRASLDTDTLYIGGGTPSVLPLSFLEQIVKALPYGPFGEFTVEVNPEDIVEKGLDYVRGLAGLGVSRVSMGVQSFDDCTLKWMNRRHDAGRAAQAFRMLREGGIGNLSIDLIFGISGVTEEQWRETVRQALHIGDDCGGKPQHISAYQLSIEEGSALEKMLQDGRYTEAPEDVCRRQYEILCEELSAAGYRHYEISNFALPGFEARHNSAYWARVPYVGLGPGAHSFDGSKRLWNSEMDDHGAWTRETELLSEEDCKVERVMLVLRTATGMSLSALRENCDPVALERLLADGSLVAAQEQGNGGGAGTMVCGIGTMVRIPEDRFFVSDDIIRELI